MPEVATPPAAAPAAPAAPAPSPNAAAARPAAAPAGKQAAGKPAAPAKPAAAAKPATPPAAAKVTNPFEEANAAMARFAEPDQEEPKPPGAAKPPAKPASAAKPGEAEEPEAEIEEEPKPGEEGKADEKLGPDGKPIADGKPGGRPSPWKLVDYHKARALKAELRVAELEAAHKPGELPKEHQEKFATLEARNKELEDEIRYVNFSKSKEFVETYQKPYEEAWANAIADLKELVITNEDGSTRVATAQDLIALANMPLGQARATAKEWFGDSADDVMSHRRTIRDLSDKQNKALEDSKKGGTERDQQRAAEQQAKHKARAEETAKVWNAINEEAVAKYEYLRPVEGETERNEKLEKAKTFVDDTFKKNVNQAKTQEERDQILRAHAALRNRAIGFSVLKHENVSLKAKVAELEKALAEFQGSEPQGGEPAHEGNGEGGGDEMGAAMSRMNKYVT